MPPPGQRSRGLKHQPGARQDSYSRDAEKVVGRASSIDEIVEALSRRGCLNLTSDIDLGRCSELPLAGGGYCDIFRGILHSGTIIAIKSLRVYDSPGMEENRKKLLKNAAKELYHWSKLRHPNILPLMGLALFRGYISMISEWMDHGNLTDYLRKYPDVDRMALCVGICDGLCHIHEGDMVHGDLKGANIMISSTGIAMIADFGNAHLKELTLKFTNMTTPGLSLRWAAPELFSEHENKMSKSSDVYAYGMTALETLTGKLPFEGKSERSLLASLAKGNLCLTRPESGIGDELWEILASCWARDPADRPPITTVRDRLRSMSSRPPKRKRQDSESWAQVCSDVNPHESYMLFETGWVLPPGTARNRQPTFLGPKPSDTESRKQSKEPNRSQTSMPVVIMRSSQYHATDSAELTPTNERFGQFSALNQLQETDGFSDLSELSDTVEKRARPEAANASSAPVPLEPIQSEVHQEYQYEPLHYETGTLVWAKQQGFPYYPAAVHEPTDPIVPYNIVGYEDVIRRKLKATGVMYPVQFYDKNRTWTWVPLNKLILLGENEEIDQKHLHPTGRGTKSSHKFADRKALKEAYHLALQDIETGEDVQVNEASGST